MCITYLHAYIHAKMHVCTYLGVCVRTYELIMYLYVYVHM